MPTHEWTGGFPGGMNGGGGDLRITKAQPRMVGTGQVAQKNRRGSGGGHKVGLSRIALQINPAVVMQGATDEAKRSAR